ncbi:hypothetical protein GQ53DRAFT_815800 [Thozetella sp. PMI_491]|nr:hypothetical protein GQ53DRAFT_815800 [Thozetella sp. PMI_491]
MATTALHAGTAPLAALTTVFTPTCSTSWLLTSTRLLSQHPPFPGAGPPGCDPPSWVQNLDGQGFQFYSPAICPDGFNVGPNCIISTQTKANEGFPPIAPGETAAWCVPSGMSCTGDTTDFRGGFWGLVRPAAPTNAPITYGPIIQIRWVDADLSRLETHPLTPGLILAGATTAPAPVETTPPPPPPTTAAGFTTVIGASTSVETPPAAATTTTSSRNIATTSKNNISTNQPESATNNNNGDNQASPNTETAVDPTRTANTGPTNQVNGNASSESATSTSASGSVINSGDARANTAIVVLLSVLVAAILGIIAFAFLRRRKAGQPLFPLPPMPAAVRLRVNRGRTYRYSNSMQSSRLVQHRSIDSYGSIDTELGADPIPGVDYPSIPPIPEMAATPARGTAGNPAELPAEVPDDEPRGRWSWMSRVSGIFPWVSRPSTPTPSQARSRPSSRWTTTTSYTADRKSFGSEKIPGLQVPFQVKPGTAKIISIYRNHLVADEPPPLPEKNALGLQVPPNAWARLSGGSAGTFGGRAWSPLSDAASDRGPPSPKPKPPEKDK